MRLGQTQHQWDLTRRPPLLVRYMALEVLRTKGPLHLGYKGYLQQAKKGVVLVA